MKYFIIGAGFSGLRIGHLLAREGKKVEIFEMDVETGGLMKTEKNDGFLFDIGPHIFFRDYEKEYHELIGNDLHNLKVLYGIGFHGKDIISPIRPANLIKNLGARQCIPLIWDVFRHKFIKINSSIDVINNAEKWVIANFGEKVYENFFKDYIPKVMGLSSRMVSEEWGKERHKFYREHNLWQKSSKFIQNFFFNPESKGGFLDVSYPEQGSQQITDALCREVRKYGGSVFLESKIDRMEISANKISHMVMIKNGIERNIKIGDRDVVISTMPVTSLFNSFVSRNENIEDIKKASGSLHYRNLWLFNFIIKRDRLKDKAQIYFPESKYIFKRVYEPKNLRKEHTNKDKTAICVEVCYNDGDEIDSMGETAVYSQVITGLKDFYNISDHDVLDTWNKTVPFAYSVYEIGYKEHLIKLSKYLFTIDNLISFGRQGSFRYNHMTNRVMDSCTTLHKFLISKKTKKEFLNVPDPKADFF